MSEWSTGSCPSCHRTIHIESGCLAECSSCGYTQEVACKGCGDEYPADQMSDKPDGYYCEECTKLDCGWSGDPIKGEAATDEQGIKYHAECFSEARAE